MRLAENHPLNGIGASSRLVRAARGDAVDTTPVWFMRQAGRSLPEYRAAREGTDMVEACLTPSLVAELTAQPVRRHNVDAGIFFSDIVVPLKLAGLAVTIQPGVGPVFDQPIRSVADIDRLPRVQDVDFSIIAAAVSACVDVLDETPLIGFAGAPFTLACYMVEGGPSRDKLRTKALAWENPELWGRLLSWVAALSGAFLRTQIMAGASVVQLFDSWAGALNLVDYRVLAAPFSRHVFDAIDDIEDAQGRGVPRIHFALGGGGFLTQLAATAQGKEAPVVGVDFHTPLARACAELGSGCRVQGNLDPALLSAPWDVLSRRTLDVLHEADMAGGHIFNLGHGVPATADPDILTRLTDFVHTAGA